MVGCWCGWLVMGVVVMLIPARRGDTCLNPKRCGGNELRAMSASRELMGGIHFERQRRKTNGRRGGWLLLWVVGDGCGGGDVGTGAVRRHLREPNTLRR